MAVRLIVVVVIAAAAGLFATKVPGRYEPFVIGAGPAVIVAVAVTRRIGPRGCLALLVVMTTMGWFTISKSVGRVNLRLTDIPYLALLGWALVIRSRRGTWRVNIGQRPFAAFVAVYFVSLLPFALSDPHSFLSSVVSWARLAETFSLVWLVPYTVERPSDRRFLMGTIVAACTAELCWAILHGFIHGGIGHRLADGPNGPDTIGLLAAILAVAVLHSGVPRSRALRLCLFALAMTGVGLTRSVGGIAALGLVLGLAPLSATFNRRSLRWLLLPMRISLLVIGGLAAIAWLRPYNVPGTQAFNSGTATVRLMYATDGLELFAQHPVLGVGFQRSSLPQNIANPTIVADLERRFPNANKALFSTFYVCDNLASGQTCDPGSVHDAYVQVLAESGVVGAVALLVAGVSMYRRIRLVRRRARPGEDARFIYTTILILLVVLIWWNDNPLYGGQPETVMAAMTLGMLAVPWASLSQSSAHDRPVQDGESSTDGPLGEFAKAGASR